MEPLYISCNNANFEQSSNHAGAMGWQLATEGIECLPCQLNSPATPHPPSLSSRQVTLNGHLLQLVDNTSLPELEPVEQEASGTISLPALSFGFQVFKEANVKICM